MLEELIAELDSIFMQLYPACSNLIGPASRICGVFTLIYIFITAWKTWGKGEAIEVTSFFRPFAITIVIFMLPGLIPTFEGILSPTKIVTESLAVNTQESIDQKLKEYEQLKEQKEREEIDEDEDVSTIDEIIQKLKDLVRDLILLLAAVFRFCAVLILAVLSTFYRLVLAILSPIVFAFSILPSFKDNIATLVKRYINVYLYVPIANILSYVLLRINELTLDSNIASLKNGGAIDDTNNFAMTLALSLMAIIGYFCVPTIAGWAIESAGGGAMNTGANKAGQAMAGGAGKAAGGALGKIMK
jgi:hypothetical protein